MYHEVANNLGTVYKQQFGDEIYNYKTSQVIEWLNSQKIEVWEKVLPANSKLSGEEYVKIWKKLNSN